MKKILVIGGGLAGLSAAVHLTNKNFKVDLLESSPKLGGRAYSFRAKNGNDILDNGQHILMGCYEETLHLMKIIGAEDKLKYQSNLEISFLKENAEQFKLKSAPLPHPFNLLLGLLSYKAITFKARLKVLKFFLKIPTYSDEELRRMSVSEWLTRENQDENISKAFWEVISVGTLNTSIKKASAKIFADILRKIFLNNKISSTIILPAYGLSETFCIPAQKFIESRGSNVLLSHHVTGFRIKDNNIVEVQTDQGNLFDFDYVVSAIPLYSVNKFVPVSQLNKIPDLIYSSILSVHLWIKVNQLKEEFYGLINSPVHWIFNKGNYLTIIISDADYLMGKPKEELLDIVVNELEKFIGLNRDNVLDFQIIKEKRATFIPSEKILDSRPDVITNLDNFFIAGDWVDTGLPSTIEGAVKSGRMVSEALMNSHKFNS
jgi:squalene-associated FAD-dependent desaturase